MVFLQSPEPCEPACSLCAKYMRDTVDTSPVVLKNELTGESKIVPQYALRGYLSMWSPFHQFSNPSSSSRFSQFVTLPPMMTRPFSMGSSTSSTASLSSLDHSAGSSPPDSHHSHHNNNDNLHMSSQLDGRAFPVQLLTEKARFCSIVESTECLRCQRSAVLNGGSSGRDSSGGGLMISGSDGYCSGRSCTSLSSSLSNLSLASKTNVSLHSVMMTMRKLSGSSISGSDVVPPKTCSFCYGQHKKHLQNLGRPWPRIQDAGPWHGHSIKDDEGAVTCPELFRLMCPLCFATGAEAHTVKFCPLNAV